MNIVLLGHLHGFGGAEKSLVMLANELSKRGHKVSLLSFTSDNNIYNLDNSVDYYFIPDQGNRKINVLRRRFFNLAAKMKELKPEIVISFWFQLAVFAMLISKTQGYKVIYSERGDPKDIEYDGLNGLIRSLSFPLIDGFVFQTTGAQNFFSKRIVDKSCVIHNAITIPRDILLEPIKKEKHIIAVGRLHRQKNFALLINAFKDVNKAYPEYKLLIYGEGEQRKDLDKLIKELNLSEAVLLCGNTRDVLRKMKKAEVFVLSSDFEGMPNVLMEAMGLGLPCVSTDCSPGGAAELIVNKKNGLLVPKGDQKKLTLSLIYLIEHPKHAEQMGIEATKVLATHSPSIIYDRWDTFIKNVRDDINKKSFS